MLPPIGMAAASSLWLLAIIVWRAPAIRHRTDLALGLSAGALFFLYQATGGPDWFLPLLLLGPLACNRSLRAGFDMGQRPKAVDAALLAALAGFGWTGYVWPHVPVVARLYDLMALCLFTEPVFLLLKNLSDDMVESRRHVRFWLAGGGAFIGPVIAWGAFVGRPEVSAFVGTVVTLGLSWVTVFYGPQLWASLQPQKPDTTPRPPIPDGLDERDLKVQARLRGLMETEALYRDPGQSLSRLAQTLTIPEHRLRRIIHRGEGFRNFSAYLNAYRLKDVRTALEDASRSHETILSLATDAGYNSLSAFNRAFREAEGVSPLVFRNARLAARTAMTTATSEKTVETDATAGST